MAGDRVIIHVDMDAFFAAIEQRDDPSLRGRPVVVGADPKEGKGRGVVSTCSYEARRYGIHSAQPISRAYRLCPEAVYLRVDGEKYRRESRRIRDVFARFTPQVEAVSIDEAFLDVTGSLRIFGGKRALAERLQAEIEDETSLTASLGVAPNKLLAKIASDLRKPRGLVVVEPTAVAAFLTPLPVRSLPGVGPKLRESLARMGIRTVGDLAALPRKRLEARFGEHGVDLWHKAQGVDDGPVVGEGEAKSISHEHTFDDDTRDAELLRTTLMWLSERVARRLRKAGRRARTITTKVRLADFTTLTRRATFDRSLAEAAEIHGAALKNLHSAGVAGRAVRLLGVAASGLEPSGTGPADLGQTSLFQLEVDDDLPARLARAEDAVKDRFGDDAIRRAASLRPPAGEADGDESA
jgi:DNA polymerase-4